MNISLMASRDSHAQLLFFFFYRRKTCIGFRQINEFTAPSPASGPSRVSIFVVRTVCEYVSCKNRAREFVSETCRNSFCTLIKISDREKWRWLPRTSLAVYAVVKLPSPRENEIDSLTSTIYNRLFLHSKVVLKLSLFSFSSC